MTDIIEQSSAMGYNSVNLPWAHWFNPVDHLVYAGVGIPNYGFASSDNYFFPVFDPTVKMQNVTKVKEAILNSELTQGFLDSLPTPYLDNEYGDAYENWNALISKPGHSKEKSAALLSPTNQATNILNVFAKVYGLVDRDFAGKELFTEIPVDRLVVDIDTALKFGGISKISELGLPMGKQLTYTRVHYEAEKFGLVFEVSYDSILKNIHNPMQDSIQVAGTKIPQRHSFDVINTIETKVGGTAALNPWDSFVAGTERSTQSPLIDLVRIITNSIEGTGEGGRANKLGLHPITKAAAWDSNSYLRGLVEPAPEPEMKPGTGKLKGMPGITYVQDQFIPQGTVYILDEGYESAGALFVGPQYVASKQDEFTKATRYGIFEYHFQDIINSTKVKRITGAASAIAPP